MNSVEGFSLRVVMVTPCYYPMKGGTETIVRNLSISLNRKNVHTDIVTFNMEKYWHPRWQQRKEIMDGMSIFKIPALNWAPTHWDPMTLCINLIPGLFTSILDNYDVVHYHNAEFSFPFFSFLVKKPKILHVHGLRTSLFSRYYLNKKLLQHIANVYISISHRMTKDLVSLGISRSKIVYLPNGIDTHLFTPNGKKDHNLLLFVGRLQRSKGLHVLLKCLRYLEAPVKLAIIGPMGTDKDYCYEIAELIKEENLRGKNNIKYLGALDNASTAAWYQKASMFVLPSFIEGFPVTILEALSCETPVIATPVGGIPEIVKDFETGILVPPEKPADLSNAIQYLLENDEVRNRFGREGRKRVIEHYSLEKSVRRLLEIYKQLSPQAS